jgi:predicted anti-sigma-YlaC factor YlaD
MTIREAISANLDGEPADLSAADVEQHLAGCASCVSWKRHAEDVSRRGRVASMAPIPDLIGAVMANGALPRPNRLQGRLLGWLRGWLRGWLPAALIVIAVAQIGIGIAQLFVPLLGHADHTGHVGLAGLGHVERETAVFNVAVGVALLWTALGPVRAVQYLLPLLLTLVTLLALVTAFDVGRGEVSWIRICTHLPVLLATLTVYVQRRIQPAPHDPEAVRPTDEHDAVRERDDRLFGPASDLGYGAPPQPPAASVREVA